jgi:hypothetical protein
MATRKKARWSAPAGPIEREREPRMNRFAELLDRLAYEPAATPSCG